jgi:HAD superfamily hydrolase (TIGR01549 family)
LSIRAVFFDLGGTLLVMRRDRIISKILSDAGYPVGESQVHYAYIQAEPSWLSIYGERTMTGDETEEAYRQLDAMIFRLLFPDRGPEEVDRVSGLTRGQWPVVEKTVPLELYPDAIPTLERLRDDHYILGLISNAPPDTVKAIQSLGLPRYLPIIVVSGVVGVSKPNPEIFRIALGEAGVGPAEAAHVGDIYEADVLGARNAGMKGLLIDRDGLQAARDCPRMRSLSEIHAHIR